MLLSFSVENFRSFKEEQTLDLIASKRREVSQESPDCRPVPGTDEHVLRVASIYGANASGKSNFVRAVLHVRDLVCRGTPVDQAIRFDPFLLDNEDRSKVSAFDLRFIASGEVFRYGFCYDAKRVHAEWLSVYEGKREKTIFTREQEAPDAPVKVKLGKEHASRENSDKIKPCADLGVRPNLLFLTAVRDLGDPVAQGPRLGAVIGWFSSELSVLRAGDPFQGLVGSVAEDPAFADFAGRFLNEVDTGVCAVKVNVKETLQPGAGIALPMGIQAWRRLPDGRMCFEGSEGLECLVDLAGKEPVTVREIACVHGQNAGNQVPFPFSEESDGTQRLLHLLALLHRTRSHGGVFVVDELERSMHPTLARKFVEFFLKAAENSSSQLIFATHESTLLDLDILRPDGIWFSEKDRAGATRLYSLADFRVRNDLRIEKGYLHGRFGAIPFVGGIDRLIEEARGKETVK